MARLTKATKPKLPFTDTRRRHTDPPVLWLAVATGSVVFHLLLAVIILPLQARRAGEALQLDPVAIDWVEIDPSVDPSVETPVAIAPASPSSDSTVAQPPESSPPPVETFPTPPPEPIPQPTPEPIPEPIPEPSPETELEPSVEEPIPAPIPPSPAEPPQPADESSPTDNLSPDVTTADSEDSNPGDGSTESTSPDDGSSPAPAGGDTGLPSVAVDANPNAVGWQTSAIVSPRPDRPFDVPTELAMVRPGRDRLPDPASFGCPVEPGMEAQMTEQEQYAQYLAEATPFLNTPVNINVTVEANGQVSEASVGSEASDSYAYNQLAVCLVTNWLEFDPAVRDGVPWASDNQQVTIIISSIQ